MDLAETQRLVDTLKVLDWRMGNVAHDQRGVQYQIWRSPNNAVLMLQMFANGGYVWRREARELSVIIKSLPEL